MRRWHEDLPMLERRLRLDQEKHRRHDSQGEANCKCKLGTFRKLRPLACPDSRLVGTGGCKRHKTLGNGRGAKKFSYLKKLLATEDYDSQVG